MDNSDIEIDLDNSVPPLYQPNNSSHTNKTVIINQPEILQLNRKGIIMLICPFENKKIITKVEYEPKLGPFLTLLASLFFLFAHLTTSKSPEPIAFAVVLVVFTFPLLYLMIVYNPNFNEIHHCSSCGRVVAVAE